MSALAHEASPHAEGTLAEALSQFALALSYDEIPVAVRERAKHLILDSVGIALASTQYPFASVSFSALTELATGTSPVIGIGRRLAIRDGFGQNFEEIGLAYVIGAGTRDQDSARPEHLQSPKI